MNVVALKIPYVINGIREILRPNQKREKLIERTTDCCGSIAGLRRRCCRVVEASDFNLRYNIIFCCVGKSSALHTL